MKTLFYTLLSIFPLLLVANTLVISKEEFLLNENLNIAKTIAIGTLSEDHSGKQYLILTRGWTNYPKKVLIPSEYRENFNGNYANIKRGIKGWRYLFFGYNETNQNGEMKSGAIVIKPLKDSRDLIDQLKNKKLVNKINPS